MTRRGNGLAAEAYTPLIDLSPRLADLMLRALREAGIAAYASALTDEVHSVASPGEGQAADPMERLYVDSDLGHAAEGVLRTQLSLLTEGNTRDAAPGGDPAAAKSAESAEVFETADALDQETADGDPIGRAGSAAGPGGSSGSSGSPGSPGSPGSSDSAGPAGSAGSSAEGGSSSAGPKGSGGSTGSPGSSGASENPRASSPAGSSDGEAGPGERDEAAIWAEIVAGYDTEFPDGTAPWPDEENLRTAADDDSEKDEDDRAGPREELDSSGRLPTARVIKAADSDAYPATEEFPAEAADDEHYIPPPPPPLPSGDPTTRFGWLALIGGPIYILVAVLLGWEVPGWAAFTAVAAFIGGFVTLVLRMGDDPRDPGDGAVV